MPPTRSADVSADPVLRDLAATLSDALVRVRRLLPRAPLSATALSTMASLVEPGSMRVGELAESESVSQPAMTQLLSRLAGAGLVERHPDPADGRVVLVTLTSAGQRLVVERRAARAQAVAERLSKLGDDDRDALAAALPALQRLLDRG